jgi:hypothetical protein
MVKATASFVIRSDQHLVAEIGMNERDVKLSMLLHKELLLCLVVIPHACCSTSPDAEDTVACMARVMSPVVALPYTWL